MKKLSIRFTSSVLLACALLSALSACAPVLMGGAVLGGFVAVDRRTSAAQLEDETIEIKGASGVRDNLGDRVHVNITSYNRRVLLSGEVPNAQDRQLVEKVVSGIANVKAITNELAVMGSSSLTQRSTDTWLTGKVKANLIDANDLFASAFKVVTERGTVYLMGRVTRREADRATEIVRATGSVSKVIRVFEYISEDELKALLPKSAPETSKKPAGK
jgi:osmotically-inducible protein OsmY